MYKRKETRKPTTKSDAASAIPRRISLGTVAVCILLVLINILGLIFFRNDVVAKRKMESMARDYYENYYYSQLSDELKAKYSERGLPAVSLRVLLSFDGGRHQTEEGYFKRTECDAIATDVVFYPKAPYGQNDYEMEINYSCNFD